MDSIAMLLITMPVFLPAIEHLHVNLVWFGIIYVKLCEIGAITPPFAIGVYVLSSVVKDDIPLISLFRGITWFLVMELLTVGILVAFPQISLFLATQV